MRGRLVESPVESGRGVVDVRDGKKSRPVVDKIGRIVGPDRPE